MATISVQIEGMDQLKRKLDGIANQIPFATALALTRTAQLAKSAIEAEMSNVFDRPTRWTVQSLRLLPARKNSLTARVEMKNEAVKSAPATKWLSPQVDSGGRPDKASERNLRARSILKHGQQTAFGKSAKLDKYGNLTKGQITKALSGIGGFEELGYSANATESSRSVAKGNRRQYFVMRKGRSALGIARRTSKKNMYILIAFVRTPTYSRKLDFYGIGQKIINSELPKEMGKAIEHAIRTARSK